MGSSFRFTADFKTFSVKMLFPSKTMVFIGVLAFLCVVNGFGAQCSKDICNKCTTVARQADRQDVIAKRYNAYDSSNAMNHLSYVASLCRRLNGCCTKFRDTIFL